MFLASKIDSFKFAINGDKDDADSTRYETESMKYAAESYF